MLSPALELKEVQECLGRPQMPIVCLRIGFHYNIGEHFLFCTSYQHNNGLSKNKGEVFLKELQETDSLWGTYTEEKYYGTQAYTRHKVSPK